MNSIISRTSCSDDGFGRFQTTACNPQGSSTDAQRALGTPQSKGFNSRRLPFLSIPPCIAMSLESAHTLETILHHITSGYGDLASSSAVCLWADNQLLVYPPHRGFRSAISYLNTQVAVKTRTPAVELALDAARGTTYLDVDAETCIAVVDSFESFHTVAPTARAVLVRDEAVLAVWSDSADTIVDECHELEGRLDLYVAQRARTPTPADAHSHLAVDGDDDEMLQFFDWSSLEPLPELPTLQAIEQDGELPLPPALSTGYWLGVEMAYEALRAEQRRLDVSPFRAYAELSPFPGPSPPLSSNGTLSSVETTPLTISPMLIGPPPVEYGGVAVPESPYVEDDRFFVGHFEMGGEYEAGQEDEEKGTPEAAWAFGAPVSPIAATPPAPVAEEPAAIPPRARKRVKAATPAASSGQLRAIKPKPKRKAATARQTAGPAGLTPLPGRAATSSRRLPFPDPLPPVASGSSTPAATTSAPKSNIVKRAQLPSTRTVGRKAKRVDYDEDPDELEEDGFAGTDEDEDEYVDDTPVRPTKRTKTSKAPSAAVGKSTAGKKTRGRRPGKANKCTCPWCGQPCGRETDLNRHLQSACKAVDPSKKKSWKCCDHAFNRYDAFRRHKRTVHGEENTLSAEADEDLDGEGETDDEDEGLTEVEDWDES
ncbi:hypothetical protein B0H21DRAFT_883840 [Amylocystis lapponica]|nr:hypothetical protein B0H21DRAFT_883840 [Amylocystis lapponica]